MPKLLNRFVNRRATVTLCAALAGITAAALPSTASASSSQIVMIEDGNEVGVSSAGTDATFEQFRALGANTARIIVQWSQIAPDQKSFRRPKFDATNPNAYPSANWTPYDNAVRSAHKYGITVDFTVTGGPPQWAEARVPGGYDPYFAYKPNASEYGRFFQAVATRYNGHFTPSHASSALPRVHFWTIFNEPNFGEDLGPQAIDGSRISVGPMLYRAILNAGWSALHRTGHGRDTILIGGFAARGIGPGRPTRRAPQGYPGDFGQTKPLQYIRTLYCVDGRYRELRGNYAKQRGCPTTASASRRFRSQNPALFSASGMSDHPYPSNGSPVTDGRGDPDYATFPDLGNLARTLDQVNRAYGSGKRFAIYNDEYGYITNPPNRAPCRRCAPYPSPATAAYYINWAEYLSYKNPRLKSYMQYLLLDPGPNRGVYAGFASGLLTYRGQKKATYYAFNLPVYMPRTSFSRRQSVEVWGDARPAPFMSRDRNGPQSVQIQLQSRGRGRYQNVDTVRINRSGGYFDTKLKFKASGNLRLAYKYPSADPFLPVGVAGTTIYSRSFAIRVH